jgi:hypothetical protein
MQKQLAVIDRKVLTPDDKIMVAPGKTVIGKPKIYDLKTGELLADEENLVVLTGREFMAQKVSSLSNPSKDLRNYEIRYFGVGDGGTDGATNAVDPQDNDEDLASPVIIAPSSSQVNTSANDYRYVANGYLKRILSTVNDPSGDIQIVLEDHEINTSDGSTTTVQKYTTIKFTLILEENEPANKPFTFNEAGLYAVKYDSDGNPTDDKILVARFTTIDKNLGPTDGLRIEWSVLV